MRELFFAAGITNGCLWLAGGEGMWGLVMTVTYGNRGRDEVEVPRYLHRLGHRMGRRVLCNIHVWQFCICTTISQM